jgi:hypothetical protein
LFRDGRELLKAGQIPEACEAFARSQHLEAKVGTLLNLADCRERQGQTATAWSLFLEAKQLAATAHDPRQREAEKRASVILGKLSYLTLSVARERRVEGLVIKRNGVAVDQALWNTAIAIDPGDLVIEASAPRYKPWSTTRTLGVKQKLDVVVEALAAEPVTPDPPPGPSPSTGAAVAASPAAALDTGAPAVDTGAAPAVRDTSASGLATRALPSPPLRPISLGLMMGGTSESDFLVGGRITGGIAVPHGALRAIGSVLHTSFEDDPDNNTDLITDLYALGLSVDYLWMPMPNLAFGGGLGIGLDVLVRNTDRPTGSSAWGTVRASPVIVRVLDGRVEAGLHLQYVQTSDRGVFLGLAAIDLFPL